MTTEYGVVYAYPDGRIFIRCGYTEAGARGMVASAAPIYPKPVQAVRCERSPWLPVDDTQEGTE